MLVSRVTSYDVDVESVMHEELLKLTAEITKQSKEELEKLLDKAMKAGKRDIYGDLEARYGK